MRYLPNNQWTFESLNKNVKPTSPQFTPLASTVGQTHTVENAPKYDDVQYARLDKKLKELRSLLKG